MAMGERIGALGDVTRRQPMKRAAKSGRLLLPLLFAIVVAAFSVSAQESKDKAGNLPAGEVANKKTEPDRAVEKAPPSGREQAAAIPVASRGVWDLLEASGVVGLVIILISIAALALVLEQVVVLRRSSLAPPAAVAKLREQLGHGELAQAEQTCTGTPSYLSYVVLAGLSEVRYGYPAVEKAMEEASQEQAARLFRKVEYLAVIANIAPMLGLLGTVYGILLAFKKVAETQGTAVPADLADGVYLALVTTVEGLVVAIPALAAYAIFRNRIDQFVGEINLLAEQVFTPIKRAKIVRKAAPPAEATVAE